MNLNRSRIYTAQKITRPLVKGSINYLDVPWNYWNYWSKVNKVEEEDLGLKKAYGSNPVKRGF